MAIRPIGGHPVCGLPAEEKERLMALSLDHDKPGWFVQHGPVVPEQVLTLIDYETKAKTISVYQSTLIPPWMRDNRGNW